MEKKIRDRYNENIYAKICDRFDIQKDNITLLDGFESYMYEFHRGGQSYILRVGHTIRRSVNLIRGEVDWINYLADGGVGVARAVPSPQGELVEVVYDDQGGQFLATSFVKAAGGPSWEDGRWNDALVLNYGRLIGRIHALTKKYKPSNQAWRRPFWNDDQNMDTCGWIPDDQVVVKEKAASLMGQLQKLPIDPDGYGLIHQDAHAGNFFVDDQGQITLFDFDDCVYSWFIYDIAMVVFYHVTNREHPEELAIKFWPLFWRGYCEENTLDPAWLGEMGKFFKLREIDLYVVINHSWDGDFSNDAWVENFMAGRRERIENDTPYLAVDFQKI